MSRTCGARFATNSRTLDRALRILFGLIAVAGAAGSSVTASLTVGLCNSSSANERGVAEMEESATNVFRHSGIEIVWIQNLRRPGDSGPCPERAAPGSNATILVRLLDLPAESSQPLYQAKRMLVGRARHDTFSVTVFYRSARAMEQNSNGMVTRGQILGYAIAHEMGHLLLASDSHAAFGIMKENYSRQDLVIMGQGMMVFPTEESRLLRARVLSGFGHSVTSGAKGVAAFRKPR
jgi:hypothetical protein